eukprot:6050414-Amphidinium_carterae.1
MDTLHFKPSHFRKKSRQCSFEKNKPDCNLRSSGYQWFEWYTQQGTACAQCPPTFTVGIFEDATTALMQHGPKRLRSVTSVERPNRCKS